VAGLFLHVTKTDILRQNSVMFQRDIVGVLTRMDPKLKIPFPIAENRNVNLVAIIVSIIPN